MAIIATNEGEGDEYWIVFKIGDQYFKVSAYYDS